MRYLITLSLTVMITVSCYGQSNADDIIGTWKIVKLETSEGHIADSTRFQYETFTYQKDNRVSHFNPDNPIAETEYGNWKIDNTELIQWNDGEEPQVAFEIERLTQKELVLSQMFNSTKTTIYYRKIK